MLSLPAAAMMGSAAGSSARRSSVVISGTSRPSARMAATALGRSSAARGGATCPPRRTVRSTPPKPARLAARRELLPVQLRHGLGEEDVRPPVGTRIGGAAACAASGIAPAAKAAADDLCRNSRRESGFFIASPRRGTACRPLFSRPMPRRGRATLTPTTLISIPPAPRPIPRRSGARCPWCHP